LRNNGSGRFGPNGARARGTKSLRDAGKKEFQIFVDLRHRPHRRTRRLDVVGLLDGNGGRDTADFVHLRLVHPLQKLAGVRAERLHVTPLALGIEGIKCQARLAAATGTGDDRQFPERDIEIDSLQIILPRTADLDGRFSWLHGQKDGPATFLHTGPAGKQSRLLPPDPRQKTVIAREPTPQKSPNRRAMRGFSR